MIKKKINMIAVMKNFVLILAAMFSSCAASSKVAPDAPPPPRAIAFESAEVQGYLDSSTPVMVIDTEDSESPSAERARGSSTTVRDIGNARHGRMVAYNVSLNVMVDSLEESATRLRELTDSIGGFVVRDSANTRRSNLIADITMRIPAQNLFAFVESVSALGEVLERNITGSDITDQYRNNIIRLENLNRSRERFLELLEKAETVTDMLAIERELERINYEIDLFTGRIKFAEESVALSQVTVRLTSQRLQPVARKKTRPGPVGYVFVGLYHAVRWLLIWD